jgi:hypothetical protein
MYFVLSRFLFNKKMAFTIAATAVRVVLILSFNYLASWIVDWSNQRIFPSRTIRPPAQRVWLVLKSVAFNYPIIGGFTIIVKMTKRGWFKQQETLQIAREKACAEILRFFRPYLPTTDPWFDFFRKNSYSGWRTSNQKSK